MSFVARWKKIIDQSYLAGTRKGYPNFGKTTHNILFFKK
jgi:hypothetical protein